MQVVPGTHLLDQIPHRDTFNENNLLTRGQEIAVNVDESQAVSIELEPGEMSLHPCAHRAWLAAQRIA